MTSGCSPTTGSTVLPLQICSSHLSEPDVHQDAMTDSKSFASFTAVARYPKQPEVNVQASLARTLGRLGVIRQ